MRATVTAAALVAFPSLTIAVSVSNFGVKGQEPLSIQDTRCAAAYNQQMSGCSDSDFQKGSCSAACVKGAQEVAKSIQASCGNVDFHGATEDENIIVCFLAGPLNGPRTICPNNDIPEPFVVSSTVTARVKTTTTHLAESSTGTSSSIKTSTNSTIAPSSKETVISTASVSPPAPLEQGASSTMSSPSSSQSSRNDGDGGGSPFDEPSRAASFSIPAVAALLTAALLAAGMS